MTLKINVICIICSLTEFPRRLTSLRLNSSDRSFSEGLISKQLFKLINSRLACKQVFWFKFDLLVEQFLKLLSFHRMSGFVYGCIFNFFQMISHRLIDKIIRGVWVLESVIVSFLLHDSETIIKVLLFLEISIMLAFEFLKLVFAIF